MMSGTEFISSSLLQALTILACVACRGEARLRTWDPFETDCNMDDGRWLPQPHIALGTPWRSLRTLPSGLTIAKSSIPGAGLGVYSDIFIPKYTWLGPYEGEIVLEEEDSSVYAWEIWRGDKLYYYLDGRDEHTSNWARYVNCARHWREENVVMLQCYGVPYYVTARDVHPGEELLVYYGDSDAHRLGVDLDGYFDGY